MALLTISTWAELVKCVSSSPIGSELLKANNYTAFEDLLLKEGAKHGITMAQNTLASGAEVAADSSIMTYTSYATEGVTGGVSTATQVASLAETEAGVTATTVGASAGAVSVGAIVGGVIGGLGLGLVAYELTPEFWTGLSNVIFGTNIQYDNIEDYSIMTLFKDGKTYIPSKTIDAIKNYLLSIGAYNNNAEITYKPIIENKTITQTIISNKFDYYQYCNALNIIDINSSKQIINPLLFNNYKDDIYAVILEHINPSLYDFCEIMCTTRYPNNDIESSLTVTIDCFNLIDNNTQFVYKFINGKDSGSAYQIKVNVTPNESKRFQVSYYPNKLMPNNSHWWFSEPVQYNQDTNYYYPYVKNKIDYGSYYVSNVTSTLNTNEILTPLYNGIVTQDGAKFPKQNEQLNITYPSWYQNALTIGGIKPDKSGLEQIQYLPIELPTVNPMTTDLAIPQAQAQLGDVTTTPQQKALLDALARIQQSIPAYPYMQNPPSTDIGNSPTPPTGLVSGTANGLMSIHNPTLSELNALGGYLWSSDIIDQILKLFQNPMDAIIGLHILYGTPSVNGRDIIKAGYLSTGVESNIVDNQYITIDCGTIQVPENSGNATDYPPFTRTSLYLPFIGIVELNAYDIIGSSVNIEYKIDVLTGSCLANVNINKNSSNAILYTYNGNCAVQLPLTGGNYASMISGLIGIGLGAMTGGVGMTVAGVMGAVSQGATVQHSGSIGSNSGAMGIKKPYLIVTRFIPFDAVNYNNYYGYPSNITCKISELSGFTKVKDIRLHSISATNKEKTELEMILKNGVIF